MPEAGNLDAVRRCQQDAVCMNIHKHAGMLKARATRLGPVFGGNTLDRAKIQLGRWPWEGYLCTESLCDKTRCWKGRLDRKRYKVYDKHSQNLELTWPQKVNAGERKAFTSASKFVPLTRTKNLIKER